MSQKLRKNVGGDVWMDIIVTSVRVFRIAQASKYHRVINPHKYLIKLALMLVGGSSEEEKKRFDKGKGLLKKCNFCTGTKIMDDKWFYIICQS